MNNRIIQRVRHVDYGNKTCLVLNRKNQAYSVNLSDRVIAKGIKEKDLAFISIINGIWIVTDFESHDLKLACDQYEDIMEEY